MDGAMPADIVKAIQSQFAPTLERVGFAGTGRRYWRVLGGQCQVAEVQGGRYSGKLAVNLGAVLKRPPETIDI